MDVSKSYPLLVSIEFSFHFGSLWYSIFVINFSRFFKWIFRPSKVFLLRNSRNNYQMSLYKWNLMCEWISYQIRKTLAVDLAKRVYITLSVYEFLNINIFIWYKALYSSFSTFWHLDQEQFGDFMQFPPWYIRKYRQLSLHKYVKILSSIFHYCLGKTNQDTRNEIH